jgi:methylase of polypeptide subunit release factors
LTIVSDTHAASFGSLTIRYDDRVLAPREWTTRQSAWIAELSPFAPQGPVLELCAGAGQIGLLAVASQPRDLVLVDDNETACSYARINAADADLTTSVEVRCGEIDAVIAPDERFALVIADPPWVPSQRTADFPEDPLFAIDGGTDGMHVAWTCVDVLARHLMDGGSAVLQLGCLEQVSALRARLESRPGLRLKLVEQRDEGRGVLVHLFRPVATRAAQ